MLYYKPVFINQFKNILFTKKRGDAILSFSRPNINQKDKETSTFKKIFFFVLFINLALAISIVLSIKKLPPEVPLLYGLPEGEEQLVKTIFLTAPAIFIIFFSIFNFFISFFIKDKFAKQILIYSLIFLSFFSFVSIIKIIFLVGSF